MSELIDNSAQRVRTLKSVIQRLHAGEDPEQVRGALRELVRQTDHTEIIQMEQELIAGGMPVEEIQSMCDLHSQVTREVLVQLAPAPLPAGHPAETMRRENEALRAAAARLNEALNRMIQMPGDADASAAVLDCRQAVNDLQDIDKHYQRKENLLFTFLEKHGFTGPSKVMWAKDDEVRALLKKLDAELRRPDRTITTWKLLAATTGAAAVNAINEMIYKEERILIPICLERFTDDEWAQIWASSPRYGWCLVEPGREYRPFEGAAANTSAAKDGVALPTGTLAIGQLIGIFSTLPVDITFVDSEDRVAFFSEGPNRIFARSRAIIGRKVQNCHPPRSVEVVERILSDFREGRQNVAEFWIHLKGQFVHIRYFAVRDEQGTYLGTLEVTQEVTRIRELQGERRLLEYAEPAAAGSR